MPLNLELALRSDEVKRWTIVNLTRPQSLAEHLFRTWLLAMPMYEAVLGGQGNSDDRNLLQFMALTHDLSECITGDIPTPVKDILAKNAWVKQLEVAARDKMGLPPVGAHESVAVMHVLKIADIAEAMIFMHQNGGHARPQVWDSVRGNYSKAFAAASRSYPFDWIAAHAITLSALAGDPTWAEAVGEVP